MSKGVGRALRSSAAAKRCLPLLPPAAQVDLTLFNFGPLDALGDARIVVLQIWRLAAGQVPAQLAGLTHLRKLALVGHNIASSWQHLPHQLQQLELVNCGLRQVPPELGGLTQLSKLSLEGNGAIEGGWQHLPHQLLQLSLDSCWMEQLVPAQLASLTQLTELELARNRFQGGWQHLPRQLQQLDLEQRPAAAASRAGRPDAAHRAQPCRQPPPERLGAPAAAAAPA